MASNKLLNSYLPKSQIAVNKTFWIETLATHQMWTDVGREAILISGSWVFGWAARATWAILRHTEGQERLLLFYNNND